MGKWLERLKNHENPRNKHCQNRQKVEIRTFDSFVGACSGDIQKKTPTEKELDEIERRNEGMVRCSECTQIRCPRTTGKQYSIHWRWCNYYTAKVSG